MDYGDALTARKHKLGVALRTLKLREERKRQSSEGGLMHFVRYFWHILEPGRPLVEGWVMDAICEHLEAVTFGDIKRLLINVSPGSSKSLLTSVFWPAWEWGPMGQPQTRYVSFSYGSHLTERDNAKFRDLVRSPEYQELWGDKFNITKDGEVKVGNDKTGWKFASSVGGVGTGERGDRILCFPYDQFVQTERGPLKIGDIVTEKMPLRVWSKNTTSGAVSLKPIEDWKHNPGSPLVRVTLADGGNIICTPNHRLWTSSGWVEAGRLQAGDMVPHATSFDAVNELPTNAELAANLTRSTGRIENLKSCFRGYFGGRSGVSGPTAHSADPGETKVFKAPSREYAGNSRLTNAIFRRKVDTSLAASFVNFKNDVVGEVARAVPERAVCLAISNILRPRAVLKIVKASITPVAVLVADFLSLWARAYECAGHKSVTHHVFGLSIKSERHARISLIKNWRHNFPWNRQRLSAPHGHSREASDASESGNHVFREPNGRHPDFTRVIGVVDCGHTSETFCLTVADNHTFYIGSQKCKAYVVSNCDDPHNVREAESDAVRTSTVQWFRESMSNRLNDLKTDAIVVIMQRVHAEDVSGEILSHPELGYVHLCIPMEYESHRHCETSIGWSDPRTEDGELAWPDRFPRETLLAFKSLPYMYSGQYQQAPEPRGGGIIKRHYWQYYDYDKQVEFGVAPHSNKNIIKYPAFDYVVASLDSAYTEKEENDPSGFTCWGVFTDKQGRPNIMLIMAWEKRLELHGEIIPRRPDEAERDYIARAQPHWGLIEWVAHECRRRSADVLLIEGKASGLSVAQEIKRLYGNEGFSVQIVNPRTEDSVGRGGNDKVARLWATTHLFQDGIIWVPVGQNGYPLEFAEDLISQCAVYPKGRKDMADSMVYALRHLRRAEHLLRKSEFDEIDADRRRLTKALPPLYPT